MAESIVFNNATYIIPDVGESNWGQNLTNYFVAIPQGCYQLSGGTAPLTADLSFGTNFGIFAKYLTSTTANAAAAGSIRLANTDSASWRNAGHSGDVSIGVNGGNQFNFSGNGIIATSFGSLTPASASSSAGVIRLAKAEAVGWRNNADNGNLLLAIDSSNNLLWNGDIIATAAASPVLSITGTANQIIASAATGNITLSTPQNIGTASTPTFGSATLTAVTNQIILGTTHTTTLSATAPAASRVYTLPDAGGAANVILDAGNYTVTGTWTNVTLVTPALGTPSAVVLTNATGTASSLTAGHVTTNANLTGVITSSGNATSIASQTGTGSKFVVDTSPTLVTPLLGTPTSGVLTNCTSIPVAQATGLLPVANGGTGLSSWPTAITYFTASGTFTTPSNSSTSTVYHYKMVGAGGGGGGCNATNSSAGGGGGGAYAEGTFTSIAASTGVTITVGAGGTAGANTGGTGGTGGSAVIGTPVSITCAGGAGGTGNTTTNTTTGGGAGGAVTGSPSLSITGAQGQSGEAVSGSGGSACGGTGAASAFGGGGPGAQGLVTGTGGTATPYGAGAGGAVGTTATGGVGAGAVIIITRITP